MLGDTYWESQGIEKEYGFIFYVMVDKFIIDGFIQIILDR